jgi:hypothetical protein
MVLFYFYLYNYGVNIAIEFIIFTAPGNVCFIYSFRLDWKIGLGSPVALPHLQTNTIMDDWIFYSTGVNSTLRFLARPSRVSVLAAGFVDPKPFIVSRLGSIPLRMKYSMTLVARLSESFIL